MKNTKSHRMRRDMALDWWFHGRLQKSQRSKKRSEENGTRIKEKSPLATTFASMCAPLILRPPTSYLEAIHE
jgi:hypothetical protein